MTPTFPKSHHTTHQEDALSRGRGEIVVLGRVMRLMERPEDTALCNWL